MKAPIKREGAEFLCEVKGPILFTTLPCGIIIAAGPEQPPVAIIDGVAHAFEASPPFDIVVEIERDTFRTHDAALLAAMRR